eukprot:CAMPEP_0115881952 /NCGR_PEP_ID=MMETSP0287-20121206/28733_1 /TAXON_ID=412157 /ORGANISM="Chrysochromulina rotalis, Strain UIO044" /LENGTH=132 /DNA_ID=CAMNT_0003337973 /DNA_START=66 /DNA_END=466 /DNA_ORIENTATION=+
MAIVIELALPPLETARPQLTATMPTRKPTARALALPNSSLSHGFSPAFTTARALLQIQARGYLHGAGALASKVLAGVKKPAVVLHETIDRLVAAAVIGELKMVQATAQHLRPLEANAVKSITTQEQSLSAFE